MQIVEFTADSLRFAESLPAQAPLDGFVWVFLDRDSLRDALPSLQDAAYRLGGSRMLDLHCKDLSNDAHPSHYDYTSVYDLIIFRRLATASESEAAHGPAPTGKPKPGIPAFHRIDSRAVGFAVFDRLLISVHPHSCATARSFIDRFLADAQFNVDASAARSRIPSNPSDLVLRMVNAMVDSYLAVRKDLAAQLGHWQTELLKPQTRFTDWNALMAARSQLHVLEDLCDEQHDAMQEWLDSLREQPMASFDANHQLAHAKRDLLVARARDVIEHIERVMHHARRLEQSAETVVQVHFSAQSNRTNDIMRTLTAITAVFLPLNLITGFFGMNFEVFPILHRPNALWWTMGTMVAIAALLGLIFWRKRYLARTGR
jgi:magnesium transporter